MTRLLSHFCDWGFPTRQHVATHQSRVMHYDASYSFSTAYYGVVRCSAVGTRPKTRQQTSNEDKQHSTRKRAEGASEEDNLAGMELQLGISYMKFTTTIWPPPSEPTRPRCPHPHTRSAPLQPALLARPARLLRSPCPRSRLCSCRPSRQLRRRCSAA